MKNGIKIKKILLICSGFLVLFAAILGGLHIMESAFFNSEPEIQEPENSKTVEKEDEEYFPRQDITTILFIGVDEEGPVEEKDHNSGSAYSDVVVLLVFDETNKEINAIALNRDSMVDMPMLDENGKRKGGFYGQLTFAHSFGNGLEQSCENTVWTVSDILYGTQIDYYFSMNMDAISIINDAVGGVTVNVKDDFSEIGSDIPMGEYTLFGDEAEKFVRSRMGIGDGLNSSRMERQKEYVFGFAKALEAKTEENSLFAMDVYEQVSDYIFTDCSVDTLSSLSKKFEEYEFREILTPKGEYVRGERFYEFYIDEEDLERIVFEYLFVLK